MRIYTSLNSFLGTIDELSEGEACVSIKGVIFPFKYKVNKKSRYLVVFTPGAFDKRSSWVRFQRSSYFNEIDASCISFFDPTLFLSEDDLFKIGWFQGLEGKYIDLLDICFLGVREFWRGYNENIIFYASSAGGIPAINLASKYEGSKVFCSNIQTDIFKWGKAHVNSILEICYNGASVDYVKEKFSSTNIYSVDGAFELFLVQNKSDDFHYKEHYLPYLDKILPNIKMKTLVYDHPESGHNPLPPQREINTIKSIMNNNDPFISYRDLL